MALICRNIMGLNYQIQQYNNPPSFQPSSYNIIEIGEWSVSLSFTTVLVCLVVTHSQPQGCINAAKFLSPLLYLDNKLTCSHQSKGSTRELSGLVVLVYWASLYTFMSRYDQNVHLAGLSSLSSWKNCGKSGRFTLKKNKIKIFRNEMNCTFISFWILQKLVNKFPPACSQS